MHSLGFPSGSVGKKSACNARDVGLIPGSGKSTGGGHGNPLQCSCLENPMNRVAWQATVCRVAKTRTGLKSLTVHVCVVLFLTVIINVCFVLYFPTHEIYLSKQAYENVLYTHKYPRDQASSVTSSLNAKYSELQKECLT